MVARPAISPLEMEQEKLKFPQCLFAKKNNKVPLTLKGWTPQILKNHALSHGNRALVSAPDWVWLDFSVHYQGLVPLKNGPKKTRRSLESGDHHLGFMSLPFKQRSLGFSKCEVHMEQRVVKRQDENLQESCRLQTKNAFWKLSLMHLKNLQLS